MSVQTPMWSTWAFWEKRPKFFKCLLWSQFLTNFDKEGCILKLRISSFQPCIICEDPWWFIYELQFELNKRMTVWTIHRHCKLWHHVMLWRQTPVVSMTTRLIGVCILPECFGKKTYESQIWSVCIAKRHNVIMS